MPTLGYAFGEMAIVAHLFPRLEQEDPEFRRELDELASTGLRIIVWVSIGANLLAYAMLFVWLDAIPTEILIADIGGALLLVGAAVASYWSRMRPYARSLGLVLLFLATIGQALTPPPPEVGFDPSVFLPVMFAISMMLGIVCLPLKPMQVLGLGVAITAFGHWLLYGRIRLAELALSDALPIMIMIILTAVSVALTAAVYSQRTNAYLARRAARQSLEALQNAQSKLFVSETAASQNRFAAALCHELNSPLGALSSSLETLVKAHQRAHDEPESAERFRGVFRDAAKSGRTSIRRLEESVDRMKRVTNLDRAEVQDVDLSALWRDTIALLDEELSHRAKLQTDLPSVPTIRGQPQKLAAVFSNMLLNAAHAIGDEAAGTIEVRGRVQKSEAVYEVVDDGKGISADRLPGLFDPAFRSDGSRVITTNWSMFVSRGIITEHGGHIEVESVEGRGTTARIFLPIEP